MLSHAAKQKLDDYSKLLIDTNLFFRKARKGEITKAQVGVYAKNLEYVFKMTTSCLKLAQEVSLNQSNVELRDFFAHKFEEEFGHDQWARDDMSNLGFNKSPNLNSSILSLMEYVQTIIKENPSLYLVYMYFAEQITVNVSPDLLDSLEFECGIPRANFTAIAKHEELDREHAVEGLDVIDRFIGEPSNPEQYLRVIDVAFSRLHQFLEDIAADGAKKWN